MIRFGRRVSCSRTGWDPATADVRSVAQYTTASQHLSTVEFVLNVIPDTVVGAFARGEVLQVLLFSVVFGLALLRLGPRVSRLVELIAMTSHTRLFSSSSGWTCRLIASWNPCCACGTLVRIAVSGRTTR